MRFLRSILCSGTSALLAGLTVFVTPGTEAAPMDTRVTMIDFGFDPVEITVPVGSTVTWVYDDPQCDVVPVCQGHDTRAEVNGPDGEPLWRSPVIKGKGTTFSATMTQVGRIPYICTIHQNALTDMDGVVNVVAANQPSAADSGSGTAASSSSTSSTSSSSSASQPSVSSSVKAASGRSPELATTGSGGARGRLGFVLMILAVAVGLGARALRASGR